MTILDICGKCRKFMKCAETPALVEQCEKMKKIAEREA